MGIPNTDLHPDLRVRLGYALSPKPKRKARFTGPVTQSKARRRKIAEWEDAMRCLPGVFIPMRTVNETNVREHWAQTRSRSRGQRAIVSAMVLSHYGKFSLPATVVMTRYGPQKMDGDNLRPALKHVQDGVQDAIGVDDGDDRWDWQHAQEIAPSFGVRIEVIERKAVGL